MNIPRPVMIGGGAVAFALAVVAMVPPTKPIGGAKVDPTAHKGFADLPAPQASPPVQPQQPQAQTASDQRPADTSGYSGPAANVASRSSETWPWRDADADQPNDSRATNVPGVQPAPRAPMPAFRPAAQPQYAYRDPQPVSDDEDRAYRQGMRWAQRNRIADPRACRDMDDEASTDGCLAVARQASRNRYSQDDDEDGPPWP